MGRGKRVANWSEAKTLEALEESAARHGARVNLKMRVADAVNTYHSGLPTELYDYALRAHFDFVVTRQETHEAVFAVEFDGPHHQTDPATILADSKKNTICELLEFPLLRVDDSFLRRLGKFSVVGWLLEMWFMFEEFTAAQGRGQVPIDEPFLWQGLPAELNPFDPAYKAIREAQSSGVARVPSLVGCDPLGYTVVIAALSLRPEDDQFIVGEGRCRPQLFPLASSVQLAEDFALEDAAQKLELYQAGKYRPQTAATVERWQAKVEEWKSYPR